MLESLGIALGKAAISMISALVTESFLKPLIAHGLEALAEKTSTDTDDKIVQDVKKAWGLDDAQG